VTDPISNPDEQGPRFRRAYETVLDEIRAVPEEDFVRISLNVTDAVTTVLGVLPKVRALGPQLSWAFAASCFPLTRFDQMETYARALGHAQTLYRTSLERPESVRDLAIKALADKAVEWRRILLCDLKVLIKRDLVAPAALGVLKDSNGYQSVVDDLFALANILRQNWTAASDRTPVTINELDQAESVAGQLRTAIGERKHAVVTASQAARDRLAAFALFVGTYREIREAVQYLRHKQGDLSAFAPSLYDGRSAGKKKENNSQPRKRRNRPAS
jgi:hypothetical protein